jgi:peptidoglycan/LPS O-acetylase OafA/YrhL
VTSKALLEPPPPERVDQASTEPRIQPPLPSSRVPELDGIRGVAILAVMLYHYASLTPGLPFHSLAYQVQAAFRLGWSGVDLFFVLSGFLIGGILIGARNSSRYFQTFYARRVFRILPIYVLWLTLFPLAAWAYSVWGIPKLAPDSGMTYRLPLYYLFLQTVLYAFPPATRTLGYYWLGPTWSVAVEEQFYLVAAPLVRFLSMKRLRQLLVAFLVVSPMLRALVYFLWKSKFYMLVMIMPCRADSFALGILTAMVWKDPEARRWVIQRRAYCNGILAVLALGPVLLTKWSYHPENLFQALFGLEFLAAFFAWAILTVLANSSGVLAAMMRWGFLREMGKVSYCMYLIHLAVLVGCHALLLRSAPSIKTVPALATMLLAFVLTYGLSKLSWLFYEGPLLKLGHRYGY